MGLKKTASILPTDLFDWMYEFYRSNMDKMTPSDIKFFKIFAKTLAYEFDTNATLFNKFVDKLDTMPTPINIKETLKSYKPNVDDVNDFKEIL